MNVQDNPRPMLAPNPAVPLSPATLPWEAYDPDHAEHDDFARTAGRCFAADCPRHDPKETRCPT